MCKSSHSNQCKRRCTVRSKSESCGREKGTPQESNAYIKGGETMREDKEKSRRQSKGQTTVNDRSRKRRSMEDHKNKKMNLTSIEDIFPVEQL